MRFLFDFSSLFVLREGVLKNEAAILVEIGWSKSAIQIPFTQLACTTEKKCIDFLFDSYFIHYYPSVGHCTRGPWPCAWRFNSIVSTFTHIPFIDFVLHLKFRLNYPDNSVFVRQRTCPQIAAIELNELKQTIFGVVRRVLHSFNIFVGILAKLNIFFVCLACSLFNLA